MIGCQTAECSKSGPRRRSPPHVGAGGQRCHEARIPIRGSAWDGFGLLKLAYSDPRCRCNRVRNMEVTDVPGGLWDPAAVTELDPNETSTSEEPAPRIFRHCASARLRPSRKR